MPVVVFIYVTDRLVDTMHAFSPPPPTHTQYGTTHYVLVLNIYKSVSYSFL